VLAAILIMYIEILRLTLSPAVPPNNEENSRGTGNIIVEFLHRQNRERKVEDLREFL
jgi:hypothetical protein